MKIALVSANRLIDPYPVYPLALAYLHAALKERIKEADFLHIDLNMLDLSAYSELIGREKPDFVSISFRNIDGANSLNPDAFVEAYRELIAITKKSYSGTKVLGGGAGFSIFGPELFRRLGLDYGLRGEGEKSLPDLIEALASGASLQNVSGLLYYGPDGEIKTNPFKPMNFLPYSPLYDESLMPWYWQKGGMVNLQTRRGCSKHCIYCTYPVIEGQKVRYMPVAKVIESLEFLVSHGYDYVFFTDSLFSLLPDYVWELGQAIVKKNLHFRWGAYFAPQDVSVELFKLLKAAGLTHIEWGTESLSDSVLKSYGKDFTFEEVLAASQMADEAEIWQAHFLILGGPGENNETVAETMEHSRLFPKTAFFPFFGMRIYPHTPLQRLAIREGFITADDPLIIPKYYQIPIDLAYCKELAKKSGRPWIFPDEDHSAVMRRLREKRNKKGPLWEYLVG